MKILSILEIADGPDFISHKNKFFQARGNLRNFIKFIWIGMKYF